MLVGDKIHDKSLLTRLIDIYSFASVVTAASTKATCSTAGTIVSGTVGIIGSDTAGTSPAETICFGVCTYGIGSGVGVGTGVGAGVTAGAALECSE